MQKKNRAIFFDFDGVLVESAEIKTEAFLELFKDYPGQLERIKEYHLKNMGVSRFKKFEWIYSSLLNKPLSQQESGLLGDRFSKIVYDKIIQAPFVKGAVDLLQYAQSEYLCFVASGTPEAELKSIVSERKLSDFFQEVCGTPRTKAEIVLEMLAKYKLEKEQCWFIGDANTDYEAAATTGLKFIARNTPSMEAYWNTIKNIWRVSSLDEVQKEWAKQ